jgi:hypothetical protein
VLKELVDLEYVSVGSSDPKLKNSSTYALVSGFSTPSEKA